ncbi:GyrI-like domain-containing protein [Clostridium sp. SHJSY1]|uniref:AraC family transcriptional regulator n=1 Tax=Clostridium sp. SHJSY1 TaxID=2942483 RepID=UPI00287450C0|nr:GyrI-like domain-containing protein [Clostridium sp. SHJSY1]MDS0526103.1 GyrI-like domain-containing protein [Clostridium sp. SHJSY1]
MTVKIEIIPANTIAYIRNIGPYGIKNIQTMERLKDWAKSKNLFNDESIIFGIAQDDPKVTQAENCRYDACIVVSKDYIITDDYIKESTLIGGKYAVFKINHTAEAVQKAWGDIFHELLINGYEFDKSRLIMERYIVKMVNNHFCEICVPVH